MRRWWIQGSQPGSQSHSRPQRTWIFSAAWVLASVIHWRYSGIWVESMRQSSNGSEWSDFWCGAWSEMPYSVSPAAMAASMYCCGVPSACRQSGVCVW